MNLKLTRFLPSKDESLGHLSVDQSHYGMTLEDEHRDVKVSGKTRIPAGTYEIKVRAEGGMHGRYKERFGSKHKGMLWLQDVPNFTWVYIHIGNLDEHTDGCILVGEGCKTPIAGAWSVTNSTPTYLMLATMIYEAIESGDKVFIEIIDGDRI